MFGFGCITYYLIGCVRNKIHLFEVFVVHQLLFGLLNPCYNLLVSKKKLNNILLKNEKLSMFDC